MPQISSWLGTWTSALECSPSRRRCRSPTGHSFKAGTFSCNGLHRRPNNPVSCRCWLSAWAVGAATVVIGQWCWLFYQDYVKKSPESLSQMHSVIIIGTLLYVLLAVPVLPFYRQLRQERVVTRSSAPVSTGRWKDKTPRTTTVTLSTSASKRQEGRHDLV